jgi:hypothetical protein
VLGDHGVAVDALGETTPPLALEVKDLARLLNQVVEDPLLVVPTERWATLVTVDRALRGLHVITFLVADFFGHDEQFYIIQSA